MLPIEKVTKNIERFDPAGKPALSLYLNLAPRTPVEIQTRLRHLLDPIAGRLRGHEARALEATVRMVLDGIDALERPPRAVAAFACADPSFVEVVPLPDPVEPLARWSSRLHLEPLTSALDEHERTAVILVDEQHGRVFRVFMGEIEEIADVDDASDAHGPSAARTGHAASGAGSDEPTRQRRHEWHVRRHLERILDAFRAEGSVTDRILLGGNRDVVHELLRLMPPRLRDRTRLVAGIPVGVSIAEIADRVLELQSQTEREREEELVDNLLERDRAHAVFGAASVLEAVADRRVHTLVYGHEAPREGSECETCGWLMTGPARSSCPRCGERPVAVSDLVDRLVSHVRSAGGRVEEVRGSARKTLATREGLAALLRYTPGPARSMAAVARPRELYRP